MPLGGEDSDRVTKTRHGSTSLRVKEEDSGQLPLHMKKFTVSGL